jgi:hypothetical protein
MDRLAGGPSILHGASCRFFPASTSSTRMWRVKDSNLGRHQPTVDRFDQLSGNFLTKGAPVGARGGSYRLSESGAPFRDATEPTASRRLFATDACLLQQVPSSV